MKIATISLDIAKSVFQVHGVDDQGRAVLCRKVRRNKLLTLFADLEPCLAGMAACATVHHSAGELGALEHEVRLMPPAYVKAYVKRHKNDTADAAAICEAVTRPTMRFVPIKSADAQSVLMLHRARHLLVRQRTAQVSAMRAQLADYGIVAPRGRAHVRDLVAVLEGDSDPLPGLARQTLLLITYIIESLSEQIRKIIDAIKDGLYHASMKVAMTGLEDRKVALERELEVADEPPPLLHPNMSKVYSRKINALYEALRSEEGRPAEADLLRTLIDRIVLEPGGDGLGILIQGDIAGILSFASADKELPATAVRGRQVPVVAGVGFEPTTFRL